MLPYKIVKNNKSLVCLVSVQYYLHTILFWSVYYGNWCHHLKNNKKWYIWSLHLHNFLWLPIIALFLRKLRPLSRNYSNFIYIFLKLKLGTEKYILPEVSVSSTIYLGRWPWPFHGPDLLYIIRGNSLFSQAVGDTSFPLWFPVWHFETTSRKWKPESCQRLQQLL